MNTSAIPEFPENLSVAITILGTKQSVMAASVVGIVGTSMFLESAHQLPAGQPVKVEAEDTLWLAEVVRCEGSADKFAVTLNIAHVLHGLGDLARLAERLLDTPGRVQTPQLIPELRRLQGVEAT